MSTTAHKKINFHFVTGNPQTDSEKRTVRTIVRSNASNRRWRLVRETAAKSKAADGEALTEPSLSPEPSNGATSHQSSTEPEEENKAIRRQRLANRDARRLSRTASQEDRPSITSPIKTVNLAQHFLGIMPATDVSMQSLNRVLQGTAASYAQLFPAGKNSLVSQMAKDWFQQCLRTSGILHTALFCQARRAQAARPGMITMSGNELMLCQTEAVHAINDKLSQQATAVDDESLRIVFSLTWHGSVKQEPALRAPRQVPLGDLQSLRLFLGIIACDMVHFRGLDRMLDLRGGLHTVRMPGLAHLISFGDVLTAASELRRPTYEYASYAQYVPEAVIDDDWVHSTCREDHPLIALGNGFAALHMWMPYERAILLQAVLDSMANYIRASDDFVKQTPLERNKALMTDQRNMTHHRLMSLCLDEQDDFEGRDLFEVTWLAAVAYSMIAIFPLAPNAARFDRLAQLIRYKMCNPLLVPHWASAPDLVLWIMVVGALCAIGTKDRLWYVNALKQERSRLGMMSWVNLKLRLVEFLWFPLASDPDGLELWEEMQQSGYVMPWESPTVTDSPVEAFPVRSPSGSVVTPTSMTNGMRG